MCVGSVSIHPPYNDTNPPSPLLKNHLTHHYCIFTSKNSIRELSKSVFTSKNEIAELCNSIRELFNARFRAMWRRLLLHKPRPQLLI